VGGIVAGLYFGVGDLSSLASRLVKCNP